MISLLILGAVFHFSTFVLYVLQTTCSIRNKYTEHIEKHTNHKQMNF